MHEVKFFFYGTLMDYVHPHAMIETKSRPATALGMLYDLGPFPGSLFGSNVTLDELDIIIGKVVTFIAPNAMVAQDLLTQFDGYEGYDPDDLEHSLYIRKSVDVLDTDGAVHKCQTYQFNRSKEYLEETAKYVPGGDWLKFKQKIKEAVSDEEDIE